MSFDIRAPNLNDLFQPVGISSTGFNDLLTSGNSSTQLVTRGNAALTPEQAHTYTLGMVLTPDFMPGFTTSLDYYQTHMSNAITSISYQNVTVQQLCIATAPAYNSPYCALATRPIAPGNRASPRPPTIRPRSSTSRRTAPRCRWKAGTSKRITISTGPMCGASFRVR